MEKLEKNIYKIVLPLKNNPLKNVNCYVIKDEATSLLIDTGFNIKENYDFIVSELEKIGIKKIDVFVTHMHSDHCGLINEFVKNGSKIFASKEDAKIMNDSTDLPYWKEAAEHAIKNGFPFASDLDDLKSHPGYEYNNKGKVDFELLKDGDVISYGGYDFKVVETKGHSPGHLCLYDEAAGIFFIGDHVLSNISPNIYPEAGEENPLKDYLESLEKVKKIKARRVLPAHRIEISDLKMRTEELINHHHHRLSEVMEIVKGKEGTAFFVASKMTWDLKVDSWDKFPTSQKWFATGEALSHLLYLYEEGKVKRKKNEEGIDIYYV
jgi:glyoxylase-like metal-dependent hydrolase (beta-lactamase superfamily II)